MKSALTVTAIVAIMFLPTIVYAEPIYLKCSIRNEKELNMNFSVRLDENNREVIHSTDDGRIYYAENLFTSNFFIYQIERQPSIIEKYQINRLTLEVEVYVTPTPLLDDSRWPVFAWGFCEIDKLEN